MRWLSAGERDAYDKLIASKDAEIVRLSNLFHTERQLSDAMTRDTMTNILVLKREGFASRAVPTPLAPIVTEVLDPIEAVIREYEEKAPKGAQVRKGLELYVARQKAANVNERDIIIGIHRGGSYSSEDDD